MRKARLHAADRWRDGAAGAVRPVVDPTDAAVIGTVAMAGTAGLGEAREAGVNRFAVSAPTAPLRGAEERGDGPGGGMEGVDADRVTNAITRRTAGAAPAPV